MKTRPEYEANLAQLIGFSVDRVIYFEVDYQSERPYYRDHAEIGHFLDFGFLLLDPSGRSAYVTWDATFCHYGLAVFVDVPPDVLSGLSYDVTNDSEWADFLGHRISSVSSYWSWMADSMSANASPRFYPQDIRLTFDNNRCLYLSAATLDDSGNLFGMSDNVLIVFHDEVAESRQIGPWAVA